MRTKVLDCWYDLGDNILVQNFILCCILFYSGYLLWVPSIDPLLVLNIVRIIPLVAVFFFSFRSMSNRQIHFEDKTVLIGGI